MIIIYLSVFTGKKLSSSFSEKEIVVAEEALRNGSKVVKKSLGLWVKISIIVARHLTELAGGGRLCLTGSQLGHRTAARKRLVAQSNKQRMYL